MTALTCSALSSLPWRRADTQLADGLESVHDILRHSPDLFRAIAPSSLPWRRADTQLADGLQSVNDIFRHSPLV